MKSMNEVIIERITESSKILSESVIVIYGCTVFAKKIYAILSQRGLLVDAIIDNDRNKIGEKYLGINIYRPDQYLLPYDSQKLVIVCSVHEQEMLDLLHEIGYTDKNILHISKNADDMDTLEYAIKQMENVRNGFCFIRKLESTYGKDIKILVAPKASGDIFIALSYMKEWRMRNKIMDYVLVGTGYNLKNISEMYGIGHKVQIITEKQMEDLMAVYMFEEAQLNIKFISGWVLKNRNSYFPVNADRIVFKDKFKYETFRLNKETIPEYPKRQKWSDGHIYSQIYKGKTIILAPYAYSSPAPAMSADIWEKIVSGLLKKGYFVYTVGYGAKEPAIKDTQRIQFSYAEAYELLEYAGGFLAARNGLCDIVHMAKCRQLIIYGKNIRDTQNFDFFSLRRNYPDFNGEEIIFDEWEQSDFLNYILDYF